jgi:2-dehydropantoate 2-reductase
MVVAVLGPGGVGGALAARLGLAGHRVLCIAPSVTAAAIEREGLTLERGVETLVARPEAVQRLDEPVDLLLVTVKAPDLGNALERVEPDAVRAAVVLPLLNGLEHLEAIRARLGRRVAAASISRFEAYRATATRIVQTTPSAVVLLASDDLSRAELEHVAAPLAAAGIDTRIRESEREVLWEKAARIGALAAATALTQRTVGELRSDPEWRATLGAAIAEACAVAAADGAPQDPAAHWAIIDALPETLTTSTARDVAAGRPSELDAVAGSIVRIGRRRDVPCPTLEGLIAQVEETCQAL